MLEPSEAPQDFNVRVVDEMRVVVKWNHLSLQQQNGDITNYTVYYKPTDINDHIFSKVEEIVNIDTKSLATVISDLKPFTEYTFKMSATNTVGEGPFTDDITVITEQASMYQIFFGEF